jgi:hypothetical protein
MFLNYKNPSFIWQSQGHFWFGILASFLIVFVGMFLKKIVIENVCRKSLVIKMIYSEQQVIVDN